MKKYLKFIIPTFFFLVITLGFMQHRGEPYLKGNTQTFSSPDKSLSDFYKQAQDLAPVQNQTSTTTFLAVGDIMLSRNVAATIKKSGDNELPFRKMAEVLKSINFNFGNLETPLSENAGTYGGHSLFFSSSQAYAKGLADFGFKILNLANNHAYDGGLNGLDSTKSILDALNIKHEGTGDNLEEAWTPAVVESNGIKICFIGGSFASINDGGKTTNNYVARIEDAAHLKSSITNAKGECDFVVATMHAGTEYTRKPNLEQTTFAHTAIDDGADMVIGAHPHWVQTIERYCPNSASISDPSSPIHGEEGGGEVNCTNPKYIFYSLGNFIFDQMWSQDTREGLTLKIQLSKNHTSNPTAPGAAGLDDLQGSRISAHLDSIELLPIIIENSSTPRPATADEAQKILQKIGETVTILKP